MELKARRLPNSSVFPTITGVGAGRSYDMRYVSGRYR